MLSKDGRSWRRFVVGVVAVAVLTTLIFPCTYFGLVDKLQPGQDRRLIPLARGLLAVRNVVYLTLFVGIGRQVLCPRCSGRSERDDDELCPRAG